MESENMSINNVSKTVAGPFLRQFTASIMPRDKVRKNGSKMLHRGQKNNFPWPHLFLPYPLHHTVEN